MYSRLSQETCMVKMGLKGELPSNINGRSSVGVHRWIDRGR